MAFKKPSPGDYIRHHEPGNPDVKYYDGVVNQLLSSQFSYTTDDGHRYLCLYTEDWEKLK